MDRKNTRKNTNHAPIHNAIEPDSAATIADTIDSLDLLDEVWNADNEAFATCERISKRQRVRLPVSAHGRRGRPSRETRDCSRARHRISQQGGMHRRRRKQIK